MPPRLTRKLLLQGVAELAATDTALGRVVRRHGPPPLWGRRADFATLLRIILEQQVSLASAAALYQRLQSQVPEISAQHVKDLGAEGLRELGFTRQKAGYCEDLATSVLLGKLKLDGLRQMEDGEAHNTLLGIRGVGPWTANIYLLMALKRPDIWPDGDLALAESARRVKGLKERPTYARLHSMALQWRPWRSVAARILWHTYLAENRDRTGDRNDAV